MKRFLVETYTPAQASIDEIEARTRLATAEVARTGHAVLYLHSIFVPEDETCFHLFQADSSDAVRVASRRAGLVPARIVETRTDIHGPTRASP